MKKLYTVLTAAAAAVLLATAASAGTVTDDLALLAKGEFATIYFDPDFEEHLTEQERIVFETVRDSVASYTEYMDISEAGYTDTEALSAFLETVFNTQLLWNAADDIVTYTVTDGVVTGLTLSYPALDKAQTAESPDNPEDDDYIPTEAQISHALADITDDMTALDKALVIHDYLVREVDYNLNVANGSEADHNVYYLGSVFHYRDAVCQGYALAYSYLLKEVEVESVLVSSKPMNHAWNMVKIDGNWYHVDVTWDDPWNRRGGFGYHIYFMLSDDEFKNGFEEDYKHYGWESYTNRIPFDLDVSLPKANVSNAFVGYCFNPTNSLEDRIPLMSAVNGKYYYLDSADGSDKLIVSSLDGKEKTTYTLPYTCKYLFAYGEYLYANTSNYILELKPDGTLNRIVAASFETIENFWLKQDKLSYSVVNADGEVEVRDVDLTKTPENRVVSGDFVFVLDGEENAVLVEYNGDYAEVIIPEKAETAAVTAIGAGVFASPDTDNRKTINKLVIPDTVSEIRDEAFIYTEITEFELPSGLVSVGDYAFLNINCGPGEITIPASVETIGNQAFYYINWLKDIYFEGNVPENWGKECFVTFSGEDYTLHYTGGKNGWVEGSWTAPDGEVYTVVREGMISQDVNNDGYINAADAANLKLGLTDPENYPLADDAYDFSLDGKTDVSDADYLLWSMFIAR